jgi:hypothetical protein
MRILVVEDEQQAEQPTVRCRAGLRRHRHGTGADR